MPGQMRREYGGAIDHVMSRGDRWKAIFGTMADRRMFLAALSEACAKAQWQVQKGGGALTHI